MRVTAIPHLGFRLGMRLSLRALGPVGEMIACAPTLGAALDTAVAAGSGLADGVSVYVVPFGENTALGFGLDDSHDLCADQAYDLMAGLTLAAVQALTRGQVRPVEVLLSHRPPVDRRSFERLARCEVRFDQYQSCVVLPRGLLDTPLRSADPARLRRLASRFGRGRTAERDRVASRVRDLMRPLLTAGEPVLDSAAARMNVAPRSLERHLQAAGTSFVQERDTVRYRVARELLHLTDLPAGDVAAALCYATPSAFVRAFRRWSGQPPTAWRAARAAGSA